MNAFRAFRHHLPFLAAGLLLVAGPTWAGCGSDKTVFACTTKNGKKLEVCDAGRTIDYSFGKLGKPELALQVPRARVSTYQWQGVGRTESYSVNIPNGNTLYRVFHATDKLPPGQVEAGVEVEIKGNSVARVLCNNKQPITNKLQGVDLKEEE